jgi:DNA gyrase subunit A
MESARRRGHLIEIDAEEDMVITVSHTNYIKRIPVSTYRRQRRGGRGLNGMGTKEDDWVEHLFIASTHDYVMFFTENGQVYWLKVYDIPQGGRASRGRLIVNVLRRTPTTRSQSSSRCANSTISTTSHGQPAGTGQEDRHVRRYATRRAGSSGWLDAGDSAISAQLTDGTNDIVLATRRVRRSAFPKTRSTRADTMGVRGITLQGRATACSTWCRSEQSNALPR